MNFDFDSGVPIYPAGARRRTNWRFCSILTRLEGPRRARLTVEEELRSARVGMAYRPFNNNSTVIRAGYGLFHTSEVAYNMVYGAVGEPISGA